MSEEQKVVGISVADIGRQMVGCASCNKPMRLVLWMMVDNDGDVYGDFSGTLAKSQPEKIKDLLGRMLPQPEKKD